eukprot:1158466-Pelagomonas_calceolata.AAC.4
MVEGEGEFGWVFPRKGVGLEPWYNYNAKAKKKEKKKVYASQEAACIKERFEGSSLTSKLARVAPKGPQT